MYNIHLWCKWISICMLYTHFRVCCLFVTGSDGKIDLLQESVLLFFLVYCKREWTKWWLKDLQCYSTETSEHDSHILKKSINLLSHHGKEHKIHFLNWLFHSFHAKLIFLFFLLSKQKIFDSDILVRNISVSFNILCTPTTQSIH